MNSLSESNKEWGLSVTQIDLRDMTVGEPRTVTVQVTNHASKPISYRVVPLQDNKLEISASPDNDTVEPRSQTSFTLEAVIFCRTTVDVDVIVIANRLQPKKAAQPHHTHVSCSDCTTVNKQTQHKRIALSAQCVRGNHLDCDLIEAQTQMSSNAFSATWKGEYCGQAVAIKVVCFPLDVFLSVSLSSEFTSLTTGSVC